MSYGFSVPNDAATLAPTTAAEVIEQAHEVLASILDNPPRHPALRDRTEAQAKVGIDAAAEIVNSGRLRGPYHLSISGHVEPEAGAVEWLSVNVTGLNPSSNEVRSDAS